MSDRFAVRLQRQGESLSAEPGQKLLEVLAENGIFLRGDCGGKGSCRKCRVEVEGRSELACRLQIDRDLSVEIPEAVFRVAEVTPKPDLPGLDLSDLSPAGAGTGLAVDLGTTTLALYLCDLADVRVVASLPVRNPQCVFGDDVISRIARAGRSPADRARLQRMVVKAVEWGMNSLPGGDLIGRMTVVGNPAMLHLLLGENPASLGVAPFRPAFREARTVGARSLGFGADLPVATLPLISGFLGADILAAALAVGLPDAPPGSMLIDIGTNGEIMLRTGDGFLATSCATGPAFEGASLSQGMPAVGGAIQAVRIDRDSRRPVCSVVGCESGKSAAGLCGSGAVSLIAELLRCRLLRSNGRLEVDKPGFILDDSARPVVFTQKDVRAIQLGKGALRAGIDLLCREAGLDRPGRLLVAGAFGSRLNPEDAVDIGMFPGLPAERIRAVGNAAGLGAVMALYDSGLLDRADRMLASTRVVNLAACPDFQEVFLANQNFPVVSS